MISAPNVQWWAIAPELVLVASCLVTLMSTVLPKRVVRWWVPSLTIAALIAATVLAWVRFDDPIYGALSGQIDADQTAWIGTIIASLSGVVAAILSLTSRPVDGRTAEHFTLILTSVAGMALFVSAGGFLMLFVGLEMFSISLYAMCALEAERSTALEAGFKYLVVGGVASAVLLYGSALIYGATGSLDFSTIGGSSHRGLLLGIGSAMVIGAFGFKASSAPFHWWTPDVYDGAPTSVTTFMASATKAVAFLAFARVLVVAFYPDASIWQPMLAAIAVASIVVGNIGALRQERLKRMLAYSSVAHAGYLMTGLVAWNHTGLAAISYALAVYVAMTMGAFTLVLMRERAIGHTATYADIAGTGWPGAKAASWLPALPGLAMVVCMVSLAGIPPTAGFLAKFGLFDAAIHANYTWLALVGVLGSAVSLVYYMRVLVAMYMRPAADPEQPLISPAPAVEPELVAGASERTAIALPVPSAASRVASVRWLAALGVVLGAATLYLGFAPNHTFNASCDGQTSLAQNSGGTLVCSDSNSSALAAAGAAKRN